MWQRATDTFKLYFDIGVPTLSPAMQNKIDVLIFNGKILSHSKIMIVGYADFLGTEKRNRDLSINRAENVKKYLVSNNVSPDDITMCEGKGEVTRDDKKARDGYPTDRRVDIVVNNRGSGKEKPTTSKPRVKKDSLTRTAITSLSELSHLKPGSIIELKQVYFPPDRHTILSASYETLRKLYDIMDANPNLKISIEGHVCCIQNAPDAWDIETNEPTLSVNRAKEIYTYLINKGIDPIRLRYTGFGKSHPVVLNEITEQDREKNRRVEIRIIDNR